MGAREERSNPDGAWGPRKDSLQEKIAELSLQEQGAGGKTAGEPWTEARSMRAILHGQGAHV